MLIKNASLPFVSSPSSPTSPDTLFNVTLTENDEEIIDVEGAALIPGLYDHHIHLLALLESLDSVDCAAIKLQAKSQPKSQQDFAHALKKAAQEKSRVRAVGYHESLAGALTRQALDKIVADKPVRIQHRSGALWVMNSKALAELGIDSTDGCLYRSDDLVRHTSKNNGNGAPFKPDLTQLAKKLNEFGVTGVTDATPGYTKKDVAIFAEAKKSPDFSLELMLMADEYENENADWMGPKKIILDDFDLPSFADLAEIISTTHKKNRRVAIHSVTQASLALIVAVFQKVGVLDGDRIEHASVASPELISALSALGGVRVVTQPNFIFERGDDYIRDVKKGDRDFLYRCRGWLSAGVLLAGGTDAPFGNPNPWLAIWAAMNRQTQSGKTIGKGESLDFQSALELFLSPAKNPGGESNTIKVGGRANFCLLSSSLEQVAKTQPENPVVAVFNREEYVKEIKYVQTEK